MSRVLEPESQSGHDVSHVVLAFVEMSDPRDYSDEHDLPQSDPCDDGSEEGQDEPHGEGNVGNGDDREEPLGLSNPAEKPREPEEPDAIEAVFACVVHAS